MPDLRHSRMLGQPGRERGAIRIHRLHPLRVGFQVRKQDFRIADVERCAVGGVGGQRFAQGVRHLRVGTHGGHSGHHVAFAGYPFGKAAGDHIGEPQRIHVKGPGGGVVDDQRRATVLAGLRDTVKIHRPQQGIARDLGENPCEFALPDAHQRLVEGFAGRLVEVDHAVAEQLLDLQAVDVGKLQLQGLLALVHPRQRPQHGGHGRHAAGENERVIDRSPGKFRQRAGDQVRLRALAQIAIHEVLRLAAADHLAREAPVGVCVRLRFCRDDEHLQTVEARDPHRRLRPPLHPPMRPLHRGSGRQHDHFLGIAGDLRLRRSEQTLHGRVLEKPRVAGAHPSHHLLATFFVTDDRVPGG